MTTDDTRPRPVRESLERFGLPQTTGRIPPEIVHPAPFEDDTLSPDEQLIRQMWADLLAERARHAALVAAARALLDHELDERGQVLEVEDNTLHLALRAALDGEPR